MPIKIQSLEEVRTLQFDPRFPNQNQTRNCYQNYVDYHRCIKKHGESYKDCQYFYRAYNIMCPNAWIERFDEQIAEGKFPGKI